MVGSLPNEPTLQAGSTALYCTGQEFGSLGSDRYRLRTDASFDPATFRFTVNQTWYLR